MSKKFDSRKVIVEATLAPLDQLAKNVDENYSTAGQLPEPLDLPGHPGTNVRYTINLFPYKQGLLRIQMHTEFATPKQKMELHRRYQPEKVLERVMESLDPWAPRLQHDFTGIKNEVKVVNDTYEKKCHIAILLCIHSATDPDKFHPDDKDAVVRMQHALFKMVTEQTDTLFFEELF